jgi:hypothetical protein
MLLIAIVKGCEEYKLPVLNLPLSGLSARRNRSLTQQALLPEVNETSTSTNVIDFNL